MLKFLNIIPTPNPEVMKFELGMIVAPSEPVMFTKTGKSGYSCDLADLLLDFKEVKAVFFGFDFISITKRKDCDWVKLTQKLNEVILSYIADKTIVLHKKITTRSNISYNNESLARIEAEIIDLLEIRVRPAVAQDGGDISFSKFVDGVVYVHLKGACVGCPQAIATLKMGIENLLMHFIPEVKKVIAEE